MQPQRLKALPIFLLAVAGICSGDTLRISGLAESAGADVERMVLKNDDAEEVLFVKKKAVLGDADVEQAWTAYSHGVQIHVKLNEAGGRKLRETTARMRHGQDRLAIIVDGRLVSAPIIQATLGSSFVISGLKDLDVRELDELAGKMSGRSTDPDGKVFVPEPPAPKRRA
jgi:preprotein translocase subunit SecD